MKHCEICRSKKKKPVKCIGCARLLCGTCLAMHNCKAQTTLPLGPRSTP